MTRRRALTAALLLAGLAMAAFACGSKEAPETTQAPAQGVSGSVEIWQGDFMPMVDPESDRNSKTPAAGRVVRLYEPVKSPGLAEALLRAVPAKLIAETTTDEHGKFYLPVEPGSYSIFVAEKNGWYFNGWNGEGVQGAVEVLPGQDATMQINITTDATF